MYARVQATHSMVFVCPPKACSMASQYRRRLSAKFVPTSGPGLRRSRGCRPLRPGLGTSCSFILTTIRSRRSRRRSSSSLLMSSSTTRGVVSVATSSLTRARSRSLAALGSACSIASSLVSSPACRARRNQETPARKEAHVARGYRLQRRPRAGKRAASQSDHPHTPRGPVHPTRPPSYPSSLTGVTGSGPQ
jgi:hypothetical protein